MIWNRWSGFQYPFRFGLNSFGPPENVVVGTYFDLVEDLKLTKKWEPILRADKLFYSPLVSVEKITYIATDGTPTDLLPGAPDKQDGDFVVDTSSEPPRLFPNSGQYWPPCLYVPNAVAIYFTAGYGSPTNVPTSVRTAMRQLVKLWHSDPGQIGKRNSDVDRLLWSVRVLDVSPTRG
jgi:hypothetical protein